MKERYFRVEYWDKDKLKRDVTKAFKTVAEAFNWVQQLGGTVINVKEIGRW